MPRDTDAEKSSATSRKRTYSDSHIAASRRLLLHRLPTSLVPPNEVTNEVKKNSEHCKNESIFEPTINNIFTSTNFEDIDQTNGAEQVEVEQSKNENICVGVADGQDAESIECKADDNTASGDDESNDGDVVDINSHHHHHHHHRRRSSVKSEDVIAGEHSDGNHSTDYRESTSDDTQTSSSHYKAASKASSLMCSETYAELNTLNSSSSGRRGRADSEQLASPCRRRLIAANRCNSFNDISRPMSLSLSHVSDSADSSYRSLRTASDLLQHCQQLDYAIPQRFNARTHVSSLSYTVSDNGSMSECDNPWMERWRTPSYDENALDDLDQSESPSNVTNDTLPCTETSSHTTRTASFSSCVTYSRHCDDIDSSLTHSAMLSTSTSAIPQAHVVLPEYGVDFTMICLAFVVLFLVLLFMNAM